MIENDINLKDNNFNLMNNNSKNPWFSESGRPITWQGKFTLYSFYIFIPIALILLGYTIIIHSSLTLFVALTITYVCGGFTIIKNLKKDKTIEDKSSSGVSNAEIIRKLEGIRQGKIE